MAIVSCTACQKKLKIADASVGKKVKCSCGHVFVAEGEGATSAPIVAAEVAEKVIIACTECGSKVKVSTISLGKKMKCPKCAGVFIAAVEGPANPVVAAPVLATPVEEEMMSFARADVKDEDDAPPPPKAKPKAGKAPPPPAVEEEDYEDDAPKVRGKAEPKRPVPAKADAPKKYPSRILVNLFVFFVLFLFIGFFALVFLMMEEVNLLEPPMTNRQYLESFGWPAKAPRVKAAPVLQPWPADKKPAFDNLKPSDRKDKSKGDKSATDSQDKHDKKADRDKSDDAKKDEKIGAERRLDSIQLARWTRENVSENARWNHRK